MGEWEIIMKEFVPKIFDVMKTYSKGQLVKDVVAGIIVAIIALPLSSWLCVRFGAKRVVYFSGFLMAFSLSFGS